MELPELKIGPLAAKLPILQGGMSIKVSTAPLAAAVALNGGVGIIGGSGLPIEDLKEQIRQAKEAARDYIIGVNIMFVAREFLELVKTAIESGADFIISGAGFSRDLFKIGKSYNIPIISIVSDVKAALLAWRCGASAIVVEGKEAGGHLGTNRSIWEILPEIIAKIKDIPVIAAGGIFNGKGIKKALDMGAAGIQMASRFVLSKECDVSDNFKKVYLNGSKEDSVIIESPVGMPGRAVKTPFIKKLLSGEKINDKCNVLCMKCCNFQYCIQNRLIMAREGDIENGVFFAGENFYQMKEILPVKSILNNLVKEFNEAIVNEKKEAA